MGFAGYASAHPEQATVVGVAEPREHYRTTLAERHGIEPENVFGDWEPMAARERFADAAVVATPDAVHCGPAVALAEKGYHILLEKPLAPTEEECRRIVDAVKANGVLLAVGHVMRYTQYTQTLKRVLDSGRIGEIVTIQHLEPVGYWHQAHSFVRGNWRNEAESSFMLLAKSCHDLDWLHYIMGLRCEAVSSFGSLHHFRRGCQPEGASDRCLDCAVEPECAYSAKKIYLGRVAKGHTGWPVDVLTPDTTMEGVTEALRNGPYGRCVYACDNDVVDHQVVNLRFEGGPTATFTMTAFNQGGHRQTRIFGTKGEIVGDGSTLRVFDFLTDTAEVINTSASAGSILGGHGGGDYGLMSSFVAAVANDDPGRVLSGPDETLESHLMVFAAERARRTERVETL